MADIVANVDYFRSKSPLQAKWEYLKQTSPQHGWASRREFFEWSLASGFTSGASLMRLDPSKPHGPDNCYWVIGAPQPSRNIGREEAHARAVSWNKTVNRFRRALGLPLFPEK